MEVTFGNVSLILDVSSIEIVSMLGLSLLTVGVFIYMKKMRKDRTMKLGNYNTLKEVHGLETMGSPVVLMVKLFTVLSLFLVATGSIQMTSVEPVSDTDFVFAIDNSPTMNIPDYPPTRLGFATSQSINWIKKIPENTEISVISFGGEAVPISTPSDQKTAIEALNGLEASTAKVGKATGDAIYQGTNILTETESRKKTVVVVTDGNPSVGRNMTEAISHAEENNVTVEIVGLTETSSTEELFQNLQDSLEETQYDSESITPPEIDRERLQTEAERTGGNYYDISNETFMQTTLEDIVMEEDSVELNSSFYILIALSLLMIIEMLLYSKYGAI